MPDATPSEIAVTIASVLVVVLIFSTLGNAFSGVTLINGYTSITPQTGENVTVTAAEEDVPPLVNVYPTNEHALRFDGTDNVTADLPDWTTSSWSSCVAADLNATVSRQGTYHAVAYNNSSVLIQYDHGDWAAYYDNGSADQLVSVPAPSPSDGLTTVCTYYENSSGNLTISAAGNSSTAALTATTSSRNVSENWQGRLDEIRAWNRSIGSSGVSDYHADPVLPIKNGRVARLMFDEGSGSTTAVYFASQSVSVGSTTWTTGLTHAALATSAYELYANPFQLQAVAGGPLDGAPVAWVEYDGAIAAVFSTIFSTGVAAMALLVVGTLVIAAYAITDVGSL